MNELSVKTVDFMGDGLLAAQDKDGIIWTGVNSFCQGIGLSKSQRDTQVQNIQSDEVLKMGCLKFQAGVFDSNNETLALQLDYVPLWLAKISITPSMKESNPELVERLIKYQLKAKDVLAQAFLPKIKPVRRKTRKVGRKTTISLYSSEHSYILKVGDDLYDLDVDEFTELRLLIPELSSMEVSQIARVVRAYLSVHEKNSPKLGLEWKIACEE